MTAEKKAENKTNRSRTKSDKGISKGITWVSNETPRDAFISIDKENRFYVSSAARDVLKLPAEGKFRLTIGYDPDYKRLIVANPEHVRVPDVKPFKFDSRNYARATPLTERMELEKSLPVRYKYVGKDYADTVGAYAFELVPSE